MHERINLVKIQAETIDNQELIREINTLAFGRSNEADLIEKLRESDAFIPELSIVAKIEDEIIGHILFTHLTIQNETHSFPSLTLAPMAIHPKYQKKGVGGKLIRCGLAKAKELDFESVIVLGHANYYPRFGFVPASKWNITCPFPAPDEAFMGIELIKNGLKGISGMVKYPAPFSED